MLQTHIEAYILHFDKIITASARKIGRPLPKNMHSLDSFIPPFDVPLNFYLDENLQVDLRARRAIVLAGAAGTGKTGRAFSEFARPLEVATVDDLRYIVWSGDRATTHLVFEEFNFEAFIDNVKVKDIYRGVSELEAIDIRLLDSQEQHTLKARFSDFSDIVNECDPIVSSRVFEVTCVTYSLAHVSVVFISVINDSVINNQ